MKNRKKYLLLIGPFINRKKRLLLLLALVILIVSGGYFGSTGYRAKHHYKKGLTALKVGKPSSAVIEFKNAIKLDPNNEDAIYQLGIAYIKAGGPTHLRNGYKTFYDLVLKKPERLDVRLRLGELLLREKRIKEASNQADFVLTKDPKNAEGHLLRARTLGSEKQFALAKDEYKKVIEINSKIVPAYHEWAAILLAEKNNKEAEALLRKAILVNPKSPSSYFVLAGLYQFTGENKAAEEQYQKVIAIDPKKKLGYFMLARFYLSQKKTADAEMTLISASKMNQKDEEPFLVLGDFYLKENRPSEAEKAYGSAKSAQPKNMTSGKKLALLYLSQSKKKEAAVEIEALLQNKKTDHDAIFLKGRLLLLDNKGLLAIDQFKKVLVANPTYPEARYYLGIAFAMEGNVLQAKTEFLDAVKEVPGDIRSHFALANLYMQSRSYDLALSEAELVLKSDPNNVQSLTILADIALIQKQDLKAESISQKILTLTPKNQSALYRMGIVRRFQKRQGDAISFFERVLSENMNGIEPLSQIVAIHLEGKKTEKAIDRVAKQIVSSPKNPRFYALQGRLYGGIGQLKKSEESFQKGILADSLLLDTYVDLSLIYNQQKKFEQGIAVLNKAIQIDPKYVPAYMMKGTINDRRENVEEATIAYEKVMELHPRHPAAANNLAWLYAEQGVKIDRALELAIIAKENSPDDPLISDTLGWVYYKKGVYLKAVSLLKESVGKVPKNPIIHYHLGMAYSKRGEPGDKKLAQKFLRKAIEIDSKFSGSNIAKETLESL